MRSRMAPYHHYHTAAAAAASGRSLQLGGSPFGPGSGLDFLNPTLPNQEDCPLGFICSSFTDDIYPCKLIQDKAYTLFDFGGIHAGIYCPENSTSFVNCPVGSYCPDPSTKLPCPAGYFCPHKTAVPEELCKDCVEGSTSAARAKWGDDLMIALACVLVLVYILSLWLHWYNKRKARRQAVEDRFLSADRERTLKARERARLERIRPRLEKISERIEVEIDKQHQKSGEKKRFDDYELEAVSIKGSLTSGSQVRFQVEDGEGSEHKDQNGEGGHRGISPRRKFVGFDLDGQIWFDADVLFDILDVDGSEDLSYEELNTFMMLDSVELLHFIKTMNELGGIYTDGEDEADMHSQLVPRHIFVENFVDALEHASNFSCSKMEAEKLFDELVAAKAKTDLEGGRSKRSRRASLSRMSRRGSHATPKLMLSDLFNSECSNYLTEAEINALAKRIRNQKQSRVTTTTDLSNVIVTKQEFVRYYPKMLEDVTGRGGGLKDFKAKSNIGDGFDLSFTKLCLTVKVGGKSVNTVNNLTGRLQAKTMTAVMGGSGSGKTSLLNALSGRASYGELSGTIRVNGIQSAISNHKNEVGYVPQDDIVYHELTVKENLMYSGRFQLQAGIKKHEIEDLADEVLANLGLTKVKDVIVGDVGKRGISGGERKRVNIGIELMRKPQILFLGKCHG